MLSSGQSTEVRAHIAQVAAYEEYEGQPPIEKLSSLVGNQLGFTRSGESRPDFPLAKAAKGSGGVLFTGGESLARSHAVLHQHEI